MTPLGDRIRALRERKGVTLKEMAADLEISSAYLSALEHGHKGLPSPMLLRQICTYFGLIWDDAEELERIAALSDPRAVVETAGLTARHTLAANLAARRIPAMTAAELDRLIVLLEQAPDAANGSL
ncbi:MAG: hypothetical protein RLY86_3917 [Pseudomonadota bacterium]|jgi:transcriptional regulator with XRE-family HTH domain